MSTHKYLDKTGLGQVWSKIKNLIPDAEDDIEILNLLSQYDYPTSIEDVDGYVITDTDNNIILG